MLHPCFPKPPERKPSYTGQVKKDAPTPGASYSEALISGAPKKDALIEHLDCVYDLGSRTFAKPPKKDAPSPGASFFELVFPGPVRSLQKRMLPAREHPILSWCFPMRNVNFSPMRNVRFLALKKKGCSQPGSILF